MSEQDRTAIFIGALLAVTAFGYAAHMWGISQAVELAIMIFFVGVYIEFVIYLFAKRSLVLKVIAILFFPLVALALFMPSSLRRRVKEIGASEGRGGL